MRRLEATAAVVLAFVGPAAQAQNITNPTFYVAPIVPDTRGAQALENAAANIQQQGQALGNNIEGIGRLIDAYRQRKADAARAAAAQDAQVQQRTRSRTVATMVLENRCGEARSYALAEGDLALAAQASSLCPAVGPDGYSVPTLSSTAPSPAELVTTRF